MADTNDLLSELMRNQRDLFQQRQVLLTFSGFLERLRANPEAMIRNSAQYLKDTFDYFGTRQMPDGKSSYTRFKMFDEKTPKQGPIIGCEAIQNEIYAILSAFVRQGYSNKLILLHGPNGSAKSSTLEAIANAMQRYSETDEGAVYTFSWIFPTDKAPDMRTSGESGPIGFGSSMQAPTGTAMASYALLDETKIASKIFSEFKDNPVFLIPMPQREAWLRQWIAEASGVAAADVEIPPHILMQGLSKRNQLIFDNLLASYAGDLGKVLRHVQVERFFYSRQYRIGIATVEPQMSIDANEKQLTMDKNISNLPSVLHNIRFHEAQGELIEANRGILEFSDMLKRPPETFKYLLTSVEKGTINLPTSTANLDTVFFGTTNEKHLDGFKTLPDFASFRSRFELVTVPYLTSAKQEAQIYTADVKALNKNKKVAPHGVELLCLWAVMTRLKQPDPEIYDNQYRGLIARLDPRAKAKLYDNEAIGQGFKASEEATLREVRHRLMAESQGVVIYEGRFGASPREVRAILQKAAHNPKFETLTPMAIFDELEKLVRDRTVYEFLQFEPRGKYHDAAAFIQVIRDDFVDIFEREVFMSMTLVEEEEYDALLKRYIQHVVATVKKERIYNPVTSAHEPPSENLMKDVEKILGVTGAVDRYREGLLGRIAAQKIDNPKADIDVIEIFQDLLRRLQEHYYERRNVLIEANYKAMFSLGSDDEKHLSAKERQLAQTTFEQLEQKFGYDPISARESLKFVVNQRKRRKKDK